MNFDPFNIPPIDGLVVIYDETMVDRVWEFPKHRFITYEAKDESWCRKLGMGREVIVPKKDYYIVNGSLIGHPTTILALMNELGAEFEPPLNDIIKVKWPGKSLMQAMQLKAEKLLTEMTVQFEHDAMSFTRSSWQGNGYTTHDVDLKRIVQINSVL